VHNGRVGLNIENIQDYFPVVTRPAEVPKLQLSHYISRSEAIGTSNCVPRKEYILIFNLSIKLV
jgi:hypothetical protein